MSGIVHILNVAGGDVELRFDESNPAESIRAGRIVKDMLRRGYALLIEVERDGQKAFERALDFDPKTNRYLIADFDPEIASAADQAEKKEHGESKQTEAAAASPGTGKTRRGRPRKSIDAAQTETFAVGRSAGG